MTSRRAKDWRGDAKSRRTRRETAAPLPRSCASDRASMGLRVAVREAERPRRVAEVGDGGRRVEDEVLVHAGCHLGGEVAEAGKPGRGRERRGEGSARHEDEPRLLSEATED